MLVVGGDVVEQKRTQVLEDCLLFQLVLTIRSRTVGIEPNRPPRLEAFDASLLFTVSGYDSHRN